MNKKAGYITNSKKTIDTEKCQSDTTKENMDNVNSDKHYVIFTAQQDPHEGPLNSHTFQDPNKIPKWGR